MSKVAAVVPAPAPNTGTDRPEVAPDSMRPVEVLVSWATSMWVPPVTSKVPELVNEPVSVMVETAALSIVPALVVPVSSVRGPFPSIVQPLGMVPSTVVPVPTVLRVSAVPPAPVGSPWSKSTSTCALADTVSGPAGRVPPARSRVPQIIENVAFGAVLVLTVMTEPGSVTRSSPAVALHEGVPTVKPWLVSTLSVP